MSFNIGHFHNLSIMSSRSPWQRFQQHFLYYRDLGFSLDISRMKFPDDFFEKMQPKIVEAGKKAATRLLELQKQVRTKLTHGAGKTAEEVARSIDADPEDVFHVLRHLASNDPRIRVSRGDEPTDDQFSCANSNS
jgi:hypothetical protein